MQTKTLDIATKIVRRLQQKSLEDYNKNRWKIAK